MPRDFPDLSNEQLIRLRWRLIEIKRLAESISKSSPLDWIELAHLESLVGSIGVRPEFGHSYIVGMGYRSLWHYDLQPLLDGCRQASLTVELAISDRTPRPAGDIPHFTAAMVDVAVSLTGAAMFEAGKAFVKHQRDRYARDTSREYTEDELVEQARRALALRLSVSVRDLWPESIETKPGGEAIGRFQSSKGDTYRVTIQMINGIALVTRLQHRGTKLSSRYDPKPTADPAS